MENVIIIAVLLCIIGGIVFYLSRAVKRGETCIGCPYSRQCGSKGRAGAAAGVVTDPRRKSCPGQLVSYAEKVEDELILSRIKKAGYTMTEINS